METGGHSHIYLRMHKLMMFTLCINWELQPIYQNEMMYIQQVK
jgi:hypothetical protein